MKPCQAHGLAEVAGRDIVRGICMFFPILEIASTLEQALILELILEL